MTSLIYRVFQPLVVYICKEDVQKIKTEGKKCCISGASALSYKHSWFGKVIYMLCYHGEE